MFAQGKGVPGRSAEKDEGDKESLPLYNELIVATVQGPSRLTRVPSLLRSGQFGQRTSRVTRLKQSALISVSRNSPKNPSNLTVRLFGSLSSSAWFTLECHFWDFSGDLIFVHNNILQEIHQPPDLPSG